GVVERCPHVERNTVPAGDLDRARHHHARSGGTISSISSYVTFGSLSASGTRRGSAVNTPSTSVKISHAPPSAAASATAVASEPPRPSVVTSCSDDTPWNPATSTILPSSIASL